MITILFWSLLAGMTLVALAFVLLPLMRRPARHEINRRDINIALYHERLSEIEQAVLSGERSTEEASAARVELDARLLADVGPDTSKVAHRPTRSSSLAMGLGLLLLLPGLAIGIYLYNSDWQLALVGNGPQAMPLLLKRLEQHLEQQPDDAEGWQILAKSQTDLRQFDKATTSYTRLNAFAPGPDSLVGEAEVRALANGGSLQGQPEVLLEQALRLSPNHPRGLWYRGLAASQRGDSTNALRYWGLLSKQELPEDFRQLLNDQIVQAGGKPPQPVPRFQIPVRVSLAPALRSQVTPDMPVFIYAKAQGQGGPPLAVARHRVFELPLDIVLDDSLSMLPDRKLSSVDHWTITARIARQGSAEIRTGDPMATVEVSRPQLPRTVQLDMSHMAP